MVPLHITAATALGDVAPGVSNVPGAARVEAGAALALAPWATYKKAGSWGAQGLMNNPESFEFYNNPR